MSERYDLIIIGGGGFGSSAAYHATLRKLNVLVIDQFDRGHHWGSSHGESRIIRKAYFEHPDYVPLLKEAYKLWMQLEARSESELLTQCGLMLAGPPDAEAIRGTKRAAEIYGLELDEVSEEDRCEQFPGFQIPDGFDVVYEPDAGFLNVEACVAAGLTLAERRGAHLLWNTPVTHWESDGQRVAVSTENGTFQADSLIITAGAWSAKVIADSNAAGRGRMPSLHVLRKVMFWFPVRSDAYDINLGTSPFYFSMPYGEFYGFPSLDGEFIKVCEHSNGTPVLDVSQLDREVHDVDVLPVQRFLREVMPDVDPDYESAKVCMYTMSPDQHFIIDQHPEFANVVVAAGFSGHGFKFASVLGKALTDLACDGQTELPIGFLSLARFVR